MSELRNRMIQDMKLAGLVEKTGDLYLRAIEINRPRWFQVHEHVVIARQLLAPYRDETKKPQFRLKPGIAFGQTPILSDLRVLELYEAAMRHDEPHVAGRRGKLGAALRPGR